MKLIKEGTISILFGCHSLFHSIIVLISWKKLYNRFPRDWELLCIFLHDIGHFQKNYLTSLNEKNQHWILGARIAKILTGEKGFNLIKNHQFDKSNKLYKPDKYSWYITPIWFIYWNGLIEPKIRKNKTLKEAVHYFKNRVKKSIENNIYENTHNFYLDNY